jgi:hypothetical protein
LTVSKVLIQQASEAFNIATLRESKNVSEATNIATLRERVKHISEATNIATLRERVLFDFQQSLNSTGQ